MSENLIREALSGLPGNWGKGRYRSIASDGTETFCGLGHIRRAMGWYGQNDLHDDVKDHPVATTLAFEEFEKMRTIMNEVAGEQYPERAIFRRDEGPNFAHFNDYPDTTEDEVVAVMEKAAVKYEEQI